MERLSEVKVFAALLELEKKLASFESVSIAERALTDDFVEYGSSGKIYNKQDIIGYYKPLCCINHVITDFSIEFLSDTVVKTSFKSNLSGKKALRTSIWKFDDNAWRMSFHQGTGYKD